MPSGKRWNVQHQFEAAAQYTPPAAKHYLVNDTTVAESDETNNCRASVQAPSRSRPIDRRVHRTLEPAPRVIQVC